MVSLDSPSKLTGINSSLRSSTTFSFVKVVFSIRVHQLHQSVWTNMKYFLPEFLSSVASSKDFQLISETASGELESLPAGQWLLVKDVANINIIDTDNIFLIVFIVVVFNSANISK